MHDMAQLGETVHLSHNRGESGDLKAYMGKSEFAREPGRIDLMVERHNLESRSRKSDKVDDRYN